VANHLNSRSSIVCLEIPPIGILGGQGVDTGMRADLELIADTPGMYLGHVAIWLTFHSGENGVNPLWNYHADTAEWAVVRMLLWRSSPTRC